MRYFSTNMDSIRFWPQCEPVAVWDIQPGVNLLRFISGSCFSGIELLLFWLSSVAANSFFCCLGSRWLGLWLVL